MSFLTNGISSGIFSETRPLRWVGFTRVKAHSHKPLEPRNLDSLGKIAQADLLVLIFTDGGFLDPKNQLRWAWSVGISISIEEMNHDGQGFFRLQVLQG